MTEVARGSEDAFARLYDAHASAVFAAALRLTGSRQTAEDLVQETFLALWDRAELFDPERGSLAAWLLAIVRHRAIDRLRVAGRGGRTFVFSAFAPELDDAEAIELLLSSGRPVGAASGPPPPEDVLVDRDTRDAVGAALATLDDQEREVILLAYRDELSQSEIAAHLDWPLGTVKTRTRRALAKLRRALGDATERAESRFEARLDADQVCAACS